MHDYTWSKAQNSYYLVSGDKNNFGDQRIKYNKGFHRNSAFKIFSIAIATAEVCPILFMNTNQERNAKAFNFIM